MTGFTPAATRRLFYQLDKGLTVLGLERITSFLTERDRKRKGLQPPKATRIRETESQYSYQRELDGYKIIVHSSYNPELPRGKRSKGRFATHGRISVLLVNVSTDEKDYQIYFSRAGAFVERTLKEVEFLMYFVNNRPMCQYCDTLLRVRQTYRSAELVCEVHADIGRQQSLYAVVPKHLEAHVDMVRAYKLYYEKKTRKKKGIKKRMRTIRKPWSKKKQSVA